MLLETGIDKLTHIDEQGHASMVDVSEKAVTKREATASAFVSLSSNTLQLLAEQALPKGDALTVAQIAGIQAAKRTSELIPLCHPLPLSRVHIEFHVEESGIRVSCTAITSAQTGVEMEALTGATVAALTLYDMVKAVEKGAVIQSVQLESKSGGKSGDFRREK